MRDISEGEEKIEEQEVAMDTGCAEDGEPCVYVHWGSNRDLRDGRETMFGKKVRAVQ